MSAAAPQRPSRGPRQATRRALLGKSPVVDGCDSLLVNDDLMTKSSWLVKKITLVDDACWLMTKSKSRGQSTG